jgi:hypothetical protein
MPHRHVAPIEGTPLHLAGDDEGIGLVGDGLAGEFSEVGENHWTQSMWKLHEDAVVNLEEGLGSRQVMSYTAQYSIDGDADGRLSNPSKRLSDRGSASVHSTEAPCVVDDGGAALVHVPLNAALPSADVGVGVEPGVDEVFRSAFCTNIPLRKGTLASTVVDAMNDIFACLSRDRHKLGIKPHSCFEFGVDVHLTEEEGFEDVVVAFPGDYLGVGLLEVEFNEAVAGVRQYDTADVRLHVATLRASAGEGRGGS